MMTTIACATQRTRRRRGGVLKAGILTLVLPLLGCNSALDVATPGIITPGDLVGPAALTALHAGAIGDFMLGYAGGNAGGSFAAGIVSASATLSDEVENTASTVDRQNLDQRLIAPENSEVTLVFQRLHRGRAALEQAAARLDAAATAAGQPDSRVGELLALEGYTYIGFAENFCSGVPVSTVPDVGDIQYGAPQSRVELLAAAIARFDAALAKANGDAMVTALAQVGKARAQLNVGDFAAAGTTAASVPPSFVYELFTSPTATTNGAILMNGFYRANIEYGGISVSDVEGGNGLPFRSAADPRVPVMQSITDGRDGSPLFVLLAYAITGTAIAPDAPTPLASSTEARLIEAEAQLGAGGFDTPGTGTLAILNDLRANFVGGPLPPLADPVTPSAREDLLFQERAFWLYATGHRLGDLRRLVRQYGRASDAVFPTGVYDGGPGVYGPDVNLPVPTAEQNNPNFTGCLDRNA